MTSFSCVYEKITKLLLAWLIFFDMPRWSLALHSNSSLVQGGIWLHVYMRTKSMLFTQKCLYVCKIS
jgi:hypothetical protein